MITIFLPLPLGPLFTINLIVNKETHEEQELLYRRRIAFAGTRVAVTSTWQEKLLLLLLLLWTTKSSSREVLFLVHDTFRR